MSRLRALFDAGQSVWLDFIERPMLHDGTLSAMIERDALRGMTSNPTIFEKALAEGTAYDEQIASAPRDLTPEALFELLETDDVRAACDRFAKVYSESEGVDGFVSIEVSPGVAHDAAATVAEAQRLWETVGRPNLMVKVPGTEQGAVAARQLIGQGINVNVTLLFSLAAYDRIIEAYLTGLEDRAARDEPIGGIASVASFFVSRVDSEVDQRLDKLGGEHTSLKGKAAVANAQLAYRLFLERFHGERWERLAALGARPQRPLWASTGTKNPAYSDVLYVESLVGPHTVNTMPPATLSAFRDHGVASRTVDADFAAADAALLNVEAAGVSLRDVTDKLLVDGLASFQKSFDSLIAGLASKRSALNNTVQTN